MPASVSPVLEDSTIERSGATGVGALSIMAPSGMPDVREGDDLARLIVAACAATPLADGDVLVIAQKIVSKAEGRLVDLATVTASAEAGRLAEIADKDARQMELVLRESQAVLRCRPGVVIVEHRQGWVLANAGIDRSNVGADDNVLLLPVDPDASAAAIRADIAALAGVDVAVVIADSIGRAWRLGTIGTAIGAAGLTCLQDLRGQPDRYGRALETSEVGHADEIAAAASLVMGQGAQGRPFAILRGVPGVPGRGTAADLLRPSDLDMFR